MHLIGKHPNGMCDKCGVRETVEHVIIDCSKYGEERKTLMGEMQKEGDQLVALEDILNPVGGYSILIQFLKATKLINRI